MKTGHLRANDVRHRQGPRQRILRLRKFGADVQATTSIIFALSTTAVMFRLARRSITGAPSTTRPGPQAAVDSAVLAAIRRQRTSAFPTQPRFCRPISQVPASRRTGRRSRRSMPMVRSRRRRAASWARRRSASRFHDHEPVGLAKAKITQQAQSPANVAFTLTGQRLVLEAGRSLPARTERRERYADGELHLSAHKSQQWRYWRRQRKIRDRAGRRDGRRPRQHDRCPSARPTTTPISS